LNLKGYPKNARFVECKNTQDYLYQKYKTKQEREGIKILDIKCKNLEGVLELSDFPDCEELICSGNKINNLNAKKTTKLKKLYCSDNQLTDLDSINLSQLQTLDCSNNYITQIPYFPNPELLTTLSLSCNNITIHDLSIFSKFKNLESLKIGNSSDVISCRYEENTKNRIKRRIYNRFIGSLKPLQELRKLKYLYISNTDLDGGAEYLPKSLICIDYKTEFRPTCKLVETKKQ
jgi:Leucine-rich repeat (LRR) protein